MQWFKSTTESQWGMTLVEAIVAVTIFTVAMLAITTGATRLYKLNGYMIAQSYQVDYARRGMDLLVRDIREMTYADDGAFPLAVMTEHEIGFYSDIDRDDNVEYIEYELIGTGSTTLQKRVYNSSGTAPFYDFSTPDETYTLSEYVQNSIFGSSTFVYYNGNGATASSATPITDIRYIEAQIIVNVDPIRDPGQYMLRSSAALRNLKDNL